MTTYSFGPTPAFEMSTSANEDALKALEECLRYSRGLVIYYRSVRHMPCPFVPTVVVRVSERGRYLEVAAICETEAQARAAVWLQENLPETWFDLV